MGRRYRDRRPVEAVPAVARARTLPETDGYFGFIFSPAGDLNRDGTKDLLIGQTGAAHLAGKYAFGGAWVYLRAGNVLADFTHIALDAGQGIASPGDVNGDGCPDYSSVRREPRR